MCCGKSVRELGGGGVYARNKVLKTCLQIRNCSSWVSITEEHTSYRPRNHRVHHPPPTSSGVRMMMIAQKIHIRARRVRIVVYDVDKNALKKADMRMDCGDGVAVIEYEIVGLWDC